MKSITSLLAMGSALLLLLPQAMLAAPAQPNGNNNNNNGADNKAHTVSTTANYGTPHCKVPPLYDLCTADNADAYCDATGFHNNFMASCKPPVCWCE
ncbi:hypothetical protein VTK56DRAFT_4424 [Thermocarpiscus australiensis]